MRDRTIHRYPEVDLDILWHTITHDLPDLADTLTQFLAEQPPPQGGDAGVLS